MRMGRGGMEGKILRMEEEGEKLKQKSRNEKKDN